MFILISVSFERKYQSIYHGCRIAESTRLVFIGLSMEGALELGREMNAGQTQKRRKEGWKEQEGVRSRPPPPVQPREHTTGHGDTGRASAIAPVSQSALDLDGVCRCS